MSRNALHRFAIRVLSPLVFAPLSGLGPAFAEEHRACRDVDFAYRHFSAGELRAIAASCSEKSMANLYYSRASRRDLIQEADTLSVLSFADGDNRSERFRAYRLYLALVEEFSKLWFPARRRRIAFLNSEYERWGDVAELRLHGYDNVADRLEGSLRPP